MYTLIPFFSGTMLQSAKGQICNVCRRQSIRPSVRCMSHGHISETKQDRPMEHCLALLIMLPHSDRPQTSLWEIFWFQIQNTASSTAVVNQAWPSALSAVSCCKSSVTLGTCCLQSSPIVLTKLKSTNRRRSIFFSQCDIFVFYC